MQSLETKSSRPRSFETETRPTRPRPSLETPSLITCLKTKKIIINEQDKEKFQ